MADNTKLLEIIKKFGLKKSSGDQVYQKMYNLENQRISPTPKKSAVDTLKVMADKLRMPKMPTGEVAPQGENSTVIEKKLIRD